MAREAFKTIYTIYLTLPFQFNGELPAFAIAGVVLSVEVLIVAEGEDVELERLRDRIAKRGVTEADVKDAIIWARGRA